MEENFKVDLLERCKANSMTPIIPLVHAPEDSEPILELLPHATVDLQVFVSRENNSIT